MAKMFNQVKMMVNPTEKEHLVTKNYVDQLLNSRLQSGVTCVITENIEGTYDADTKTLIQTGGKVNTDGIALLEKSEILLISQNDKSQNGIYTVNVVPAEGTMGEFVRSERMDDSAELFSGMLIPVHQGNVYKDSIFQLINDGAMTLDSTSLVFEKYKGSEEGAKKYKEAIVGDDVATTWTITHGLDTKDVDVNIYDNATGEKVYFGVNIVSENAIEIISGVVLTPDDKFDVVVIG